MSISPTYAADWGPGNASPFLGRPGLLERTVLTLTLFLYAWGTPIEWLNFANEVAVTSSALTQVLFLGFFGASILALNGNWHVVLLAAKREPLVPMFLGLITISALWSTRPVETFQAGIVLFVTYTTAMHLIVRFRPAQIMRMFAVIFAAGAILNIGFVAVFEDITDITAISGGDGWSGATFNKNTLGRSAVLGTLACAAQARLSRSLVVWPMFAVVNALLVIGSNSATSFGSLLGITALSIVLLGFRGRKTLYGATMTAMIVIFSVVTLFAATNLATVTGFLGKDAKFTGRVPIWLNSFRFGISERPLTGYGWDGFWRTGIADFEVQLRSRGFDIPHAHNAWIDAWLAVGPLGTLLLTGILARGLVWGTRHIRATPGPSGLFPALIISLAFLFSSTEAGFVSRSIQFIMFVVALTLAAEQKGQKRSFEPRDTEDHLDLRDSRVAIGA